MPKPDEMLRHFHKDTLGLSLLKKKLLSALSIPAQEIHIARGLARLLKLFGFRQLQKPLPIPPAGIDV